MALNILLRFRRKIATAVGWKPYFANTYEWLKACSVFLTGRRGGAMASLAVPIRLATQKQPIYLRCGSSDFVTFNEVFMDREYEAVLRHAPKHVRGILDLGANVGLASRWFLQAWPTAQVVAVEPDEGNVAVLRRNLTAVECASRPHVVFNAFVGGWSRNAVLQTRGEGFANEGILSDSEPRSGQLVLPVITPRQLLNAATPIDVVKMDIEGAEKEILEGDLSWLQGCAVVVMEVHAPLDKCWLTDIVKQRLPSWTVSVFETRHTGAHLAILSRQS